MDISLIRATPVFAADWLSLRSALWPDAVATHARDIEAMLRRPGELAVLAYRGGRAVGLAEAALRRDYVNGCETSPVAFLEGLYVVPDSRRQGVGAALCAEIERWGREQGCQEFASDTALDNHASQALHRRLGFAETERVVFFRKPLA
ncbi:GNAT family N-acetyltransferase [Bordetella hinzii]|uniref:aminoglycoside 6'-N-acetyltransferase n=1 Tax=Bordetella hinzii TaxID=103855 RepID=UPI0013EFF233|nr:aminoglycoside 6'-N-acetyltransferase [Bordetella hinzii]QII83739.1 GNAT family N-acetyltransferase [Bordetella hinzii]